MLARHAGQMPWLMWAFFKSSWLMVLMLCQVSSSCLRTFFLHQAQITYHCFIAISLRMYRAWHSQYSRLDDFDFGPARYPTMKRLK